MKPVLYLDSEMPRTYMIPDNDPDHKLYDEWQRLCHEFQFADDEEEGSIEKARKALQDFRQAHSWKEAPLVKEQLLMLGKGCVMRGYGRERRGEDHADEVPIVTASEIEQPMPQKSYLTHPDNILILSDEEKAKLDIRAIPKLSEYMKKWGLA